MIGTKISAAEGKIFRRISDGMLFGNEIHLGMAFPPGKEPYEELPEHFEEIDDLAEYEILLMDEDTPLVENTVSAQEVQAVGEVIEESSSPEPEPPARVTLADYRELEKKVELLMKLVGGI